jgi:hypothetical protein
MHGNVQDRVYRDPKLQLQLLQPHGKAAVPRLGHDALGMHRPSLCERAAPEDFADERRAMETPCVRLLEHVARHRLVHGEVGDHRSVVLTVKRGLLFWRPVIRSWRDGDGDRCRPALLQGPGSLTVRGRPSPAEDRDELDPVRVIWDRHGPRCQHHLLAPRQCRLEQGHKGAVVRSILCDTAQGGADRLAFRPLYWSRPLGCQVLPGNLRQHVIELLDPSQGPSEKLLWRHGRAQCETELAAEMVTADPRVAVRPIEQAVQKAFVFFECLQHSLLGRLDFSPQSRLGGQQAVDLVSYQSDISGVLDERCLDMDAGRSLQLVPSKFEPLGEKGQTGGDSSQTICYRQDFLGNERVERLAHPVDTVQRGVPPSRA